MANYWIGDAKSRVLGPIPVEALQQLVRSGRVHGIVKVSTDGQSWAPVEQFPEIAELQAAHAGEARRAWERQEAQRLRAQLVVMTGRAPHEIFELPEDSSLDTFRAAFFRLVKRFYPESLPADADPALRAVSTEIFGFLSGLMISIERRPPRPGPPPPAAEPVRPRRPPPVLAPAEAKKIETRALQEIRRPARGASLEALPERPERRAAAPATARERLKAAANEPTYESHEFVGLERRDDDRLQVTVQVTVTTCRIFTENKLLNISSGGAFIPCPEALELGSEIDLVFQFKEPAREVKASGAVVWWNAGDARQARGFGVRFKSMAPDDRSFIERFVRTAAR